MQSSEGRSSGVSSEKETFQGSPLEERSGQTMKHLLICLFRDDAGTGVPSSPRKQMCDLVSSYENSNML